MIASAPGLRDEIVSIYENGYDRPARELLAILNSPARLQSRGFEVLAEHLLAVVVDEYRHDTDCRYAIYDYDSLKLISTAVFETREEAEAELDPRLDYAMIVRFRV